MPIASRLGVPVFRKKSEKDSIVSIKALSTHRSEEDATKIFLKSYQKSWALSMDTTSCGHEVNLLCFDFLWKSLSPVHVLSFYAY
jgi:hypothetical protein